MRGIRDVGPLLIGSAVLVAVVVLVTSRTPSRDSCVALWNAPRNAATRVGVSANGYRAVQIDGTYSEGRYGGCFAWFLHDTGEPWALFSALRIPGEGRPLRWTLDLRGRRWGIDIAVPEPVPGPNAVVVEDGSIRLAP
jgi:hypothetical protein